ncbi:MAG: NAD(P)H-hydrate dehydratase [Bacteroidota bacterium]
MKILTAAQIHQADNFTIEKEGIDSDTLMERAAHGIFDWIDQRLKGAPNVFRIFCGVGNNGGDGIALARMLHEADFNVAVYVVNFSEKRSDDFLKNMARLKERKLWPEFLNATTAHPVIGPDDIIIDAIFGIGYNRTMDDWVQALVQSLNASSAFVLSVDVPSGMPQDWVPNKNAVVHANHVLSFQTPKLAFFLPQTGPFLEGWQVLDIQLDAGFLATVDTDYLYVTADLVRPMLKFRKRFSHKGTYGHAIVIGGSKGKMGAVQLAAKACLRSGCGLVSAYVPELGYIPLETGLPEVMVLTDKGEEMILDIQLPFVPTTVALGMGLGMDDKTEEAFGRFMGTVDVPIVIDADGINLLAERKDFRALVPKDSILTPHPKELERLLGPWKDDYDKLEKAQQFCKDHQCILCLKDAYTIVVDGEKGYINSTGNPGMATAGSGDVLAGILTGLLAQGYTSLNAAILGVYLHGNSGDIAASQLGQHAMLASNITEFLGASFLALQGKQVTE